MTKVIQMKRQSDNEHHTLWTFFRSCLWDLISMLVLILTLIVCFAAVIYQQVLNVINFFRWQYISAKQRRSFKQFLNSFEKTMLKNNSKNTAA